MKYFITCFFIFFHTYASAQNLSIVKQWKVNDITDIVTDQYNGIYISDELGIIKKYNEEGILLLSYSGEVIFPINTIDVSHTNKIFAFYQNNQSYLLLDRNLNVLNQATLNPEIIGFAITAAFSSDNNLWIFDGSDFSLKKLNLMTGMMMTSISLSLILTENQLDITQIDEYQNRLFLNNKNNNVLVLDNMGNYIKSLPIQPEGKFWFSNDDMVFMNNHTIYLFDIYQNDMKTVGTFKEMDIPLKIIQQNEEFIIGTKDKVIVLR